MESVISDWNLLETDVELEIIKKHSDFGRLYAFFFTCEINVSYYTCIIQYIRVYLSHINLKFFRWIYLFYLNLHN